MLKYLKGRMLRVLAQGFFTELFTENFGYGVD